MPRKARPLLERFFEKVEITEGCWLWQGTINEAGYGLITSGGKYGRNLRAHRIAYETLVGPIPDCLTLDHLCRVRHCVNPDHLEPVTLRENVLRGEGSSAQYARRTHCPNGHEYNAVNTRYRANGVRDCRICDRIRWRTLRTRTTFATE